MAEFTLTVNESVLFSVPECITDGCDTVCEFAVKRPDGNSITLTDVTTSGYTNFVLSINEDNTFFLVKTLPYSFTLTNQAIIKVTLSIDNINAPQFKLEGEDTTDVVTEIKTLTGSTSCP